MNVENKLLLGLNVKVKNHKDPETSSG